MDKEERKAFEAWFKSEHRSQSFESIWIAACKWQRERDAAMCERAGKSVRSSVAASVCDQLSFYILNQGSKE